MAVIKKLYLVSYNIGLWLCWARVALLTAQSLALRDFSDVAMRNYWAVIGVPVMIAQTLAIMEVVHAALGLVRSPPAVTALQVFSRLQIVWVIWYGIPATRDVVYLLVTVVAWTVIELIRYLFYAADIVGQCPFILKWARYTGFIVLYPMGIYGEVRSMVHAMPYMLADARYLAFPSPMPNAYNFEVNVYYLYVFALLLYVPGSIHLYRYMLSQRKKKLYHEKERKD
eukprot:GHVU01158676.1.p1 GENE.GHVU01158676.1~~GHVU01158676.1.p1  ORF type:complete len:227 (-),score=4.91 GHVU01158676.1:418-1098(-)